MAPSPTVEAKGPPASLPISILDNPISQVYTYTHTAALLTTFIYTFPNLVSDPIGTMLTTLLPLAVFQGLYCIICLPSTHAGGSNGSGKGRKKPPNPNQGIGSRIIPAILSLSVAATFGAPLLTLFLVLFGAPLTTHQLYTLLAGAHFALLAGPQLVYVHGVSAEKWLRVASLDLPVDEVFGASLGTCVGAWAGAVPIPLDWDREWQKWPVTILAGGYVGWGIGKALGGTLGKGVRVRLG